MVLVISKFPAKNNSLSEKRWCNYYVSLHDTGCLGLLRVRYGQFTSVTPAPYFHGSLLSLMLTEGPLGIFLQMYVYYYIIPSYTSWEEVVTSAKKITNYFDFCDRIITLYVMFRIMFSLTLVWKRFIKIWSRMKSWIEM